MRALGLSFWTCSTGFVEKLMEMWMFESTFLETLMGTPMFLSNVHGRCQSAVSSNTFHCTSEGGERGWNINNFMQSTAGPSDEEAKVISFLLNERQKKCYNSW